MLLFIILIILLCFAGVVAYGFVVPRLFSSSVQEQIADLFTASEHERFFSASSLAVPGTPNSGILPNGDYVSQGTVKSQGFKTKADLEAWPLTYAAGHPYYASSPSLEFGVLQGGSWGAHVKRFARIATPTQASGSVLLVTALGTGNRPACIGGDLDVRGIVVRRGGVFFVDEGDITIRTGFIIVESGGLFQAGSRFSDAYRYKGNLRVVLTHEADGYGVAPVPASEYSTEVYNPGFSLDGPVQLVSYMGSGHGSGGCSFGNIFGPKSVGVGFNGNYHLAGAVSAPVAYKGTWKATSGESGDVWEGSLPLTIGANSPLPDSYSLCWARLMPGFSKKGSKILRIEPEDLPSAGLVETWRRLDRVVVTTCTKQFVTSDNVTGMPLLWMDGDRQESRAANEQANRDARNMSKEGVEVCRIESVSADGTITLAEPLRFDHDLGDEVLRRDSSTIRVETRLHVGWLSRRILVTAERTSGGGGCNNMANRPGAPAGPGGRLVANYGGTSGVSGGEIYDRCYNEATRPAGWEKEFTGGQGLPTNVKGHWLFDTEGLQGCSAIYGGQQIFRFGACVSLDGVEVRHMGVAPNFGYIGQYAVHFHLAGYAQSFRGFLPDARYPRELRVVNSSIWASYSRWVTLHGTIEAEVRNNVCFVTYGNGFFVEDGTELRNDFDHNLCVACLTSCGNDYWNPVPIYGNTVSDVCVASVFWFKNNQNSMTRNVCCCCPAPIIAVWYLPQKPSLLRGMSAVCIGSETLGLPGFASEGCALGFQNGTGALDDKRSTNANGHLVKFSRKCQDGSNCACWVPEGWNFALTNPRTGCNAFTTDNSQVPPFLNAENVAYCITGFQSEFPEATIFSPLKWTPNASAAPGCGTGGQSDKPQPVFLPENGLNSCSDHVAIGTYSATQWDSGLPSAPISQQELSALNDECNMRNNGGGLWTKAVPKIFSNLLLFNGGPMANGLYWGAGWTKDTPAMLINCALLLTAVEKMGYYAVGSGRNAYSMASSTNFVSGYNMPTFSMPGLFVTYRNLMTNGGIAALPYPCIFTGPGTFVDEKAVFGGMAMESGSEASACFNYFFKDLGKRSVDKVFGKIWNTFTENNDKVLLRLVDLDKGYTKSVYLSGSKEDASEWRPVCIRDQTRKFPYLCAGAEGNWGLYTVDGRAAIGAVTGGFFDTQRGLEAGAAICEALSLVPPRLPPLMLDGRDAELRVPPNGLPRQCGIPTPLELS